MWDSSPQPLANQARALPLCYGSTLFFWPRCSLSAMAVTQEVSSSAEVGSLSAELNSQSRVSAPCEVSPLLARRFTTKNGQLQMVDRGSELLSNVGEYYVFCCLCIFVYVYLACFRTFFYSLTALWSPDIELYTPTVLMWNEDTI